MMMSSKQPTQRRRIEYSSANAHLIPTTAHSQRTSTTTSQRTPTTAHNQCTFDPLVNNIDFCVDSRRHADNEYSSLENLSNHNHGSSHNIFNSDNDTFSDTCDEAVDSETESSGSTADSLGTSNASHENKVPDLEPPSPNRGTQIQARTPLRILQWNCQSVNTASADLHLALTTGGANVALLSEVSCRYGLDTPRREMSGFQLYQDQYSKTSIYIAEGYKQVGIDIDDRITAWYKQRYPNCCIDPKGRCHGTAAVICLNDQGRRFNLLLLSFYRPPRRATKATDYDAFLRIARETMALKYKHVPVDGWLCGGDFNASHPSWGAPPGRRDSDRHGKMLATHIRSQTDRCVINRQPPGERRFRPTRTAIRGERIDVSWIDVTIADTRTAKLITTWNTDEKWAGSDHHQILLELDATSEHGRVSRDKHERIVYSWKLTNDCTKWQEISLALEEKWTGVSALIAESKFIPRAERATRLREIAHKAKHVFHDVANRFLGVRRRKRQFKKWIGGKAQKASIQLNDALRALRKRRHPTSAEFREIRRLRRIRRRCMGNHKTKWLSQNFREHGIQGKSGWQVASECRDMNEHKGRSVNRLKDPDDPTRYITDKKQISESLCTGYHRFNGNAELPAHWCWTERWKDVMPSMDQPRYPRPGLREDNTAHCPIQEERIEPDDADIPCDARHAKFADIIKKRTQRRRKYARKHWSEEIAKLDAPITLDEIKRALSGFSTNKAQGPDELHVTFFKKTGDVGKRIALELCRLMYDDWQMVPQIWKERIIRPIIKAGKKGDELKHLRPVSLTSYVGKILEKVMGFRLATYIIRLRLLSPQHFAYLRGRSTMDCVVYLMDQIQRNMRRRAATHVVYFDLSSAFDTVQHKVLIWKLEHEFFITGKFLDTLAHFLTERRSFVRMAGADSGWQDDIIGMPQGGGLSAFIYILYVDGIGVIDKIFGVRIAIYSDDIALFSTLHNLERVQAALQESIFFIEWYCGHHGLLPNHDKTKYVIYKKVAIRAAEKLHLRMTGWDAKNKIHRIMDIKWYDEVKEKKPVKYLGIWLDRKLDFSYHARAVLKQVRGAWYPTRNNLRHVYRISAEVPWTMYDACAMSIFEYSAVIWPLMLKKDQNEWRKLYNRILCNTMGSCKGESIDNICLQLGTYSLDVRMKIQASQYFTRMIRTPRSSILYEVLERKWWKRIQHKLDSVHYVRRARRRTERWRGEEWKPACEDTTLSEDTEFQETVIWHLCRIAEETENDDWQTIGPHTRLSQIPRHMGHFCDLTKDALNVQMDERAFEDNWYIAITQPYKTLSQHELLLFTDGSVTGRAGGYGYHAIRGSDYVRLCKTSANFEQYSRQSDRVAWTGHHALSTRCSIDMCEMYAILNALREAKNKIDSHDSAMSGIRSIRIVSDSETVLKWITGEYSTKEQNCKDPICRIRETCRDIRNNGHGPRVQLQWTHSHSDLTFGNDAADAEARLGYELTQKKRKQCYDLWSYYHQRAVLNRCHDAPRDKMKLKYAVNILTSAFATVWRDYLNLGRFGTDQQQGGARRDNNDENIEHSLVAQCNALREQRATLTSAQWKQEKTKIVDDHWRRVAGKHQRRDKIPGVNWNQYFKQELKLLTRDEIRIIQGIRSGHNHLNAYMHQRLRLPAYPSDQCYCGTGLQTMEHVVRDCTDGDTRARVETMQISALREYHKAWEDIALDPEKKMPHWIIQELDLTAVRMMAFPIRGISGKSRQKILQSIIYLYRWVIKKNKQIRSGCVRPPHHIHRPFERG